MRFKIGQRVRMTSRGLKYGLGPWQRKTPCFGTVTAVTPPLGVSVRRDGTKRTSNYHIAFWLPANDDIGSTSAGRKGESMKKKTMRASRKQKPVVRQASEQHVGQFVCSCGKRFSGNFAAAMHALKYMRWPDRKLS